LEVSMRMSGALFERHSDVFELKVFQNRK
jgi:hypothetical protein